MAGEAETWIRASLGPDYARRGNVREREQFVRNIMIRGSDRPRRAGATASPRTELMPAVLGGTLTADEPLRRYCTLVSGIRGILRTGRLPTARPRFRGASVTGSNAQHRKERGKERSRILPRPSVFTRERTLLAPRVPSLDDPSACRSAIVFLTLLVRTDDTTPGRP